MLHFDRMKTRTKLIGLFLTTGFLPIAFIGAWSVIHAQYALEEEAFRQMESVRDIKKGEIEQYFAERKSDMAVLTETVATLRREAVGRLEGAHANRKAQIESYFQSMFQTLEMFAASKEVGVLYERLVKYHVDTHVEADGVYDVETEEYNAIHRELGRVITAYQAESGAPDVYLVCAKHGHVMFSVGRGKELGANLRTGPFMESGLAQVWRKILGNKGRAVVDFSPYAAADNRPAAFAGVPIKRGEETIGVLIEQLSLEKINKVMGQRTGLGETGETYLVGSDFLMRSDSPRDPEHRSVAASFAAPGEGRVDSATVRDALAGKSGARVISGYRGDLVLSAYAPLQVQDLTWALLGEIELTEAFCPKDEKGVPFCDTFKNLYGYYDLFLIDRGGLAFYTVAKEADYRSDLLAGPYAGTNLGALVKKTLATKAFGFTDFTPYAPSNNEPAAFIAQPVLQEGEVELVLALQLSLDGINAVMKQRAGMGKTGETYLVGSDKLMRSDSFLDGQGHSVKASFAGTVEKNGVDTEASRAALAGAAAVKNIIDYNGNPVLSAFTPVKVFDSSWALLAEIDEAEVDAPATAILKEIVLACLLLAAVGLTVALFITRGILRQLGCEPSTLAAIAKSVAAGDLAITFAQNGAVTGVFAAIREMVANLRETVGVAEQIAAGDLTVTINKLSERDVLGQSLETMVEKLSLLLSQIASAAGNVSSGSQQMSATSQALSQGASEQAGSLQEITSAMHEVSNQTRRNAENAAQARELTLEARKAADKGDSQMGEMVTAMSAINEASENVTRIIKVIDEIAFQTNLLALNAAVEAARAGKHGKGFKVVAEEVRTLASHSAMAAKETAEMIEGAVQKARKGMEIARETADSLSKIVTFVSKTSELVGEIAVASDEQARGISQMTIGIAQIEEVTQQGTANAEESAASSEELASQAVLLKELIATFQL